MRTQAISIAYVVTAIFGVELWRFYILPGMPLTEFMRLFLIFTAVVAVPVSLYNIWQHYKSKERWVWGRGVGSEWVRVYIRMHVYVQAYTHMHARTQYYVHSYVYSKSLADTCIHVCTVCTVMPAMHPPVLSNFHSLIPTPFSSFSSFSCSTHPPTYLQWCTEERIL